MCGQISLEPIDIYNNQIIKMKLSESESVNMRENAFYQLIGIGVIISLFISEPNGLSFHGFLLDLVKEFWYGIIIIFCPWILIHILTDAFLLFLGMHLFSVLVQCTLLSRIGTFCCSNRIDKHPWFHCGWIHECSCRILIELRFWTDWARSIYRLPWVLYCHGNLCRTWCEALFKVGQMHFFVFGQRQRFSIWWDVATHWTNL